MSEAIKWYPQLKSAFKHLVPMGTATNVTYPYVETNYSLPTFAQCLFLFYPAITSLIRALPDTSGTTVLSSAAQLPQSSTQQGSNAAGGAPAPALSGA